MVPILLIEVPDNIIPFAVELLLFKIKLPVPLAPPLNVNNAVPALFVNVVPLPLTVNAPVIFKVEVVLLCRMLVTLEPMPALIKEAPDPLPEFVIVPMLLIEFVDNVIPFAVELLLFKIKLPVPLAPPLNVNNALPVLLTNVVPLPLTVNAPVTFNAEVVLLCVIPVTLLPIALLT